MPVWLTDAQLVRLCALALSRRRSVPIGSTPPPEDPRTDGVPFDAARPWDVVGDDGRSSAARDRSLCKRSARRASPVRPERGVGGVADARRSIAHAGNRTGALVETVGRGRVEAARRPGSPALRIGVRALRCARRGRDSLARVRWPSRNAACVRAVMLRRAALLIALA